MIRIAVVDDEKDCQDNLLQYIGRYREENDGDFQVTVFQDGLDLIEGYCPVWDIIFMDIKMKHMDGMEAAEKIRRCDPAVLIIFITTMGQYAIKGYEVDALDFVLKPVIYARFETKMRKALCVLKKKEEKYLLLPAADGKERVSGNEILFIEVRNHNLHVVTQKQTYRIRYALKDIEKQLMGCHFARCNNSYLVNLGKVTGIQKESALVHGYELPISRPKKKEFLKALSDYLGAGYQ